jgi:hypothetical protein
VTHDHLAQREAPDEHRTLQFTQRWIRLAGSPGIELSMLHTFRVARGQAQASAYYYDLRLPGGSDLFQFHWHPHIDRVPWPHVHARMTPGVAARHHIPTSRVSLESVIRFTILELGVRPMLDNWRDILDANERVFAARLSWCIRPSSGPAELKPWPRE